MILPAKQARAIAAGRVTQLRIPATRKLLKVGHDYPVSPGKGKGAIGRFKVLAVRTTTAGDLTFRDAKAEGHKITLDAKAAWVRLHDARWVEAQEVSTDDAGTIDVDRWLTNTDLAARFDARHAHRLVQIVAIEPLADLPRFLSSQHDVLSGRTADDEGCGDYTTNRARAIDDLEAVDARTQERYSKTADQHAEEFYAALEKARAEQRAAKRNPRVLMFRNAA